jgi:hypothetical protein
MLPPVLEIYVVWHPKDAVGLNAAYEFLNHFQGNAFSGLIGGAIEIYIRSEGWRTNDDAPRPIPFPETQSTNGIIPSQITAIIPVLDIEFAAAVEEGTGPWHDYATQIVNAQKASPERVGVFPLLINPSATDQTKLGNLFSRYQFVAVSGSTTTHGQEADLPFRDLAQALSQLANTQQERLTIFISHTKRESPDEEREVHELVGRVRSIISHTRLASFFDAQDLQPGRDWDEELRMRAGTSAMLVLRTDLYSSREWCKREMLIAKREGMPIVVLDALGRGESRGSFLMDHVPRVRVQRDLNAWIDSGILNGLNLLVDECLRRELWRWQSKLSQNAQADLGIDWWAPNAPEPTTLIHWLEQNEVALRSDNAILRVLHPDPPLGTEEDAVLKQILKFGKPQSQLDILTPRILASRGG